MRIALLDRTSGEPAFSYTASWREITSGLPEHGIHLKPFRLGDPVPKGCDLLWDLGLDMNHIPRVLRETSLPVVVTIRGMRHFTLPLNEISENRLQYLHAWTVRTRRALEWRTFRHVPRMILAVSEWGREEVLRATSAPPERVRIANRSFDPRVFHEDGPHKKRDKPYFLHVSDFQLKKNVQRVFEAYDALPSSTRPTLIAILPRYDKPDPRIPGLEIIREAQDHTQLAEYYRGALGFCFPSLHETFGRPIIEAMACGCPVITAHDTACAEVAGNAALLVDPRSTTDIAYAMRRLMDDTALRENLRLRGLERCKIYPYTRTVDDHVRALREALEG